MSLPRRDLRVRAEELSGLQRYSDELEAKLLEKNRAVQTLTADLAVEACRNHDLTLRIAQLEKALMHKTNGKKKDAQGGCFRCGVQ